MKMRSSCLIVAAAACVLFPTSAFGWNAGGHRIIGMIAFEQLSADDKAKVAALLSKHPRFQDDFVERMPDNLADSDRAAWLATQAAVWPDITRGWRNKKQKTYRRLYKKYHRGTWHYINEPLYLETDDVEDLGIPSINLETDWDKTMDQKKLNVVQAIKKARAELADSGVPEDEKAVALCWLFHLVGDVHQPLHATALFSTGELELGDRGGNRIKVGHLKPNMNNMRSLHSEWDKMLGGGESMRWLKQQAKDILDDDARKAAAAAAVVNLERMQPETWVEESYEAAWDYVYTEDILDAVAEWKDNAETDLPYVVSLTPDYKTDAKSLAKSRAAEAGFRLAKMLEELDF